MNMDININTDMDTEAETDSNRDRGTDIGMKTDSDLGRDMTWKMRPCMDVRYMDMDMKKYCVETCR